MEDDAAEPAPEGPRVLRWNDLIDDGKGPEDIAAEAALIPPGALACIIYTSGTGGAPRGVMLPHRAILSNCAGAFELVRALPLEGGRYLSFLPLGACLRAYRRPVLHAQHRPGSGLCARRGAPRRRHADGAADHH